MSDDGRKIRAKARANWTIEKKAVKDLPEIEVIDAPPNVLIALCTQLSLQAWAMSGKPLPTYTRENMPIKVFRPSDNKP